MKGAGLLVAVVFCPLLAFAGDEAPLAPFPVESATLGPVKLLALRFSDTVDHGRSIRPPEPGGSWARDMADPFVERLKPLGIEVNFLKGPDNSTPSRRIVHDGTAFSLERDRPRWLAERPKDGDRRFDAYLVADFAHRENVRVWVDSHYWIRYSLLNKDGAVVFSKVYAESLRTLALDINRVNREARLLEDQVPAKLLSDLEPLLKPK